MTEPRALFLSPAYDTTAYLAAESLGLRSVAAALARSRVEVEVREECPTPVPADVRETAARSSLIGLGVLFTRQIPDAMALARELRTVSPGAHIIVGGQGLEFLWSRVLDDCPEIDSACMHEGDELVGELWQAIDTGGPVSEVKGLCYRQADRVTSAGIRPPVRVLDDLPFPYRGTERGGYRDGHATMSTSRGCAAHCTFCQSGNYGNRYHRLPRWRARSAASIVEEVSDLVTGHGVHTISFVDDDFLGGDGRGRERAFEFAELLRRREHQIKFSIECRINELDDEVLSTLREVGLRHVLIGVESANDTDIALFAKKTTNDEAERAIRLLRALDIDFSTGFIMFQPLSELDGIRTNLAFLARNRIGTHRRIANRLELYPGAPLSTYFQRRGVAFHEDRYRLYYDFENPGVAVLYSAFQEVLRPFESVEFEAQKALFEAATSPCGEDIARAHALKAVLDDIAGALVAAAFTCLEAVQAEEDPRSAEGIGAGVRRDCAELTERVRRIAGRREGTKEGRSHVGHGQ